MATVFKKQQTWTFDQFPLKPSQDWVKKNEEESDSPLESSSSSISTTPSSPQSPGNNANLPAISEEEEKTKILMSQPTYSNSSINMITEPQEIDSKDDAYVDDVDNRPIKRNSERLQASRQSKRKKVDDDDDDYMDLSRTTKRTSSNSATKPKRTKFSVDSVPDTFNIDITPLLELPQKQAAFKLGISESMLCKRFKESTKRKWPFRYLRKIEKTIKSLKAMKKAGNISPQDQIKLDDLLSQKRECLAPVKIRITNHDRLQMTSFSHITKKTDSSQVEKEEDHDVESEEDEFAIETLGLLRSMTQKV